MTTYIIEHLEPRLWKWCMIEYKHISQLVGKEHLWFTNIKKGSKELEHYGKVLSQPVKELSLRNACLLDPDAPLTLTPREAETFDHFIFGGILGDYPPQKRTKKELTPFLPQAQIRNLGKKQFSTDNAVLVTKLIHDGTPLEQIPLKYKIEIPTGKSESVILPYQYVLKDNKPFVSEELISYLKKKKGF